MATDAMVGNDILLYINQGTDVAPDYVAVAGQRDYSHDASREGIDVSHKGSDHAQAIPGRQEGTVSVTLLVLRPNSADTTQAALKNSFDNRLPVTVREVSTFPGAASDGSEDSVLEAEGYVLSYSKSAGDNAEATFDVEITLNEALSAPPPPAP